MIFWGWLILAFYLGFLIGGWTYTLLGANKTRDQDDG